MGKYALEGGIVDKESAISQKEFSVLNTTAVIEPITDFGGRIVGELDLGDRYPFLVRGSYPLVVIEGLAGDVARIGRKVFEEGI